ncbi:helix-turn-helix domain-containing protein [Amycolatopsis sp. H20-H5]|nr:helix-turn-helix domain-containing protein [Amycolatopsis sp. H20-H5]MEC3976216.1 helix-turn-helix domain-containing protein [Amycolatopsis sp. H20-H5]
MRELITAFEAGTTRLELAKRYGIGRSSVAKVLREWRKSGSKGAA